MPRPPRIAIGNVVYHVLNRAHENCTLFSSTGDYAAFERIMADAVAKCPMRILAYCLMPNHWHMLLHPVNDDDLINFMWRITHKHAKRWREYRDSLGRGHLYQGRYKSFPVQTEEYLLNVLRYVEQNALRAGLTDRTELWRWSSAWYRIHSPKSTILSPWPFDMPDDYLNWINVQPDAEVLKSLRSCKEKGSPYGTTAWVKSMAERLHLTSTLRDQGRPRRS